MRRALLLALLLATPGLAPAAATNGFLVGVSPEGSPRAIVIENAGARAALVDLGEGRLEAGTLAAVRGLLPDDLAGTELLLFGGTGDGAPADPAATAKAIRVAAAATAPAELRFGRSSLRGLVETTGGPGRPVDEAVYALEVRRPDGARAAVVALASARPAPAPAGMLLLSGSPGDSTVRGEGFAARVEAALTEATALEPELGVRTVRARLPASLLGDLTPNEITVTHLDLGTLALLAVPGRMDTGPAIRIRSALEATEGGHRFVVGPANLDVGRIPDPVAFRAGEAGPEARYGPGAADAVAVAFGVGEPSAPTPPRPDRGAFERAIAALAATPQERVRIGAAARADHRFLTPAEIEEIEDIAAATGLPYDGIFAIRSLGKHRDYPAGATVETLAPATDFTRFRVDRVWFDSPDPSGVPANDHFPVEHYVPRGGTARAAVVILPIWKGGVLLAERIVAGHLADEGYECAIVPLPWQFQRSPEGVRSGDWTLSSDLERTRAALLQARADVRAVTDWLHARPSVDRGRVAVLGISLGAHVAAVAYQTDPRYGAGVIVMAGGDPASMVWAGSRETSRMKRDLVARGFDLERLRAALHPLDPAAVRDVPEFPAYPRYRGVLMVNASYDQVVPPRNAEILQTALGRPGIHWLPTNHYTMALKIPEVLALTDRHLDTAFPR